MNLPYLARELLRLYRTMLLIRRCEEQLAQSHQRGLVHGACHTYVGQEAIAVGVCAHLRRDDVVFSTHRGHGHALAKGVPPLQLIAELFGRATGCSRGRGGSMHLFSPEVGMMGTSGIVGPCILQAAGAGYSFKLLKTDHVARRVLRRRSREQRRVPRRAEPGRIWKLPVLFVCENNQFATEVPFEYAAATRTSRLAARPTACPGSNSTATTCWRSTPRPAKRSQRARSGGGPTLLECKTYRTRPHAEGMGDFTYRTREDVEDWKAKCPIERLRRRSSRAGVARDGGTRRDRRRSPSTRSKRRTQFAEASPWPDPATAATHVYAEPRQRSRPPPPPGDRA